jgi:predicted SnoaL-like aldol condensation-catalyzing enzyme
VWLTVAVGREQEETIEWHGISMYRIADGKIAEIWDVRTPETKQEAVR